MITEPEKLPTVNGYEYAGFWGNAYHFRKKVNGLFYLVSAKEEFIKDGSYLFMLEHDLSEI